MSIIKKPFYSVVSNQAANKAEIYIYGVIGASYWDDGNEAKQFVLEFKTLAANFPRVDIHINSPGGSVWDGLPMFNAINSSDTDTHTYCDGIAFSMGFMLLLAGKTIHAAKGSLLMCHNVSGGVYGNAKDMRKAADMMDKHDEILCELIIQRSGKDEAYVLEHWMNYEDNFLTPKEAESSGLVDVIESYEAKDVPENIKNMNVHQIAAYYSGDTDNPSESFMEKVLTGVKDFFKPQNSNTDMGILTTNKFKSLSALAKVAAAAITAEQLQAVNDELTAEGITGVSFVLDADLNETLAAADKVEGLENSVKTKDGEIEKLTNELNAQKAIVAEQAKKLGQPAADAGAPPVTKTDTTPKDKNDAEPSYETSYDREMKAHLGK